MRRLAFVLIACAAFSCGDGTPAPTPSPSVASAEPTPDERSTEATPEQGGTYWGVYLAVSENPDDLDEAAERARDLGFTPSVGELACDQGAAEALGYTQDQAPSQRVAIYFETEADARAVAQTTANRGVASVQTYCLD